ncbi:MAG: hypothetical protein ABGZ17_19465 [Planctomycetaceae bacterium]
MRTTDHILVYLSIPGPQPKWLMQDVQSGPLACRKLPSERLVELELPAGGELWEITLPSPQFRSGSIQGIRTRATSVTNTIALPFLPRSTTFRGRAALIVDESALDVSIDVTGLQPQSSVSEDAATIDANWPVAQRWTYSSPHATLSARRKVNPPIQQVASLKLSSHIAQDRASNDVHLAQFHVQSPTSTHFRFTLPKPAQLISTKVNGRSTQPQRDGAFHILTSLAPDSGNIVAVRYRTPAARSLIRTTRSIVLPRIDQTVIRLEWFIALPDGTQPIRTSPILRLLDETTVINWNQRLFGNLGRAPGRPIFHPLSELGWNTALQPGAAASSSRRSRTNSEIELARGYSQWTVVGNMAPSMLNLVTVDNQQCRQCSWIALLGGAVVILMARVSRLRIWTYLVGIWITVCLVTAALATAEIALIVGSSLTGVLIGSLLPQSILHRLGSRNSGQAQRMASTIRYRRLQQTSLLLIILWCCESVAQEGIPILADSDAIDASRDVLLPQITDPNGQQPDVAYVHQTLLQQLQANLSILSETQSYLIQSSRFDCAVRGQSAIINAHFQVLILDGTKPLRIYLPIEGANVGGAEACRVNGVPTPILKSTTRPGFEIDLSRSTTAKTTDSKSAVLDTGPQSKAQDGSPRQLSSKPATTLIGTDQTSQSFSNTVDIELTLYPPTKPFPGGASFEINVPPVMASVMTASFDREYAFVDYSGSARVANATQTPPATTPNPPTYQTEPLIVDFGKRRTLWLKWSATKPQVRNESDIQSSIRCLVDIAPSRLLYDYTFDFQARSTQLDHLTFQLPKGSHVLKVSSEQLLSYDVMPQSRREQLLVEFTQSQTASFSVSISLVLPLAAAANLEVQVPCVNPLAESSDIEVNQRVVSMTAQSPFELELKESPPATNAVDPELLVNGRPSDYAFELSQPTNFTFQLHRRRPKRRVYQTQEAWIGTNRIDWFVSAEIETDETPAFQHELWFDPRLSIESVSVIEDGAERLVRWNREEERLTLFLSGKTTGLQNLSLKAHLPRKSELSTRLPIVRLLNAVTLESYLTLSHDRGLTVDILDPQHIQPDENKTPQSPMEADTLMGRYLLSDNAKMPRIQTATQQSTVIADVFTTVSAEQQPAWRVLTRLHFRPNNSRQPHRVLIPSTLKTGLKIESSAKVARQLVDEPDGALLLLIDPPSDSKTALNVTLTAVVTIPPNGQWELPHLTLVNCQHGDRLLGLPAHDNLTLSQADSTFRSITSLPEWAADLAPTEQDQSQLTIHRYSEERPQSTALRLAAGDATRQLVSLILHHLQFPESNTVSGQTAIYLVSSAADRKLKMQLPNATDVRAVVLNGSIYVKPTTHSGTVLEIPLDDVNESAVVVDVYWTHDLSQDVALLAQVPIQLPRLFNQTPEQSLLLLDQPQSFYCVAGNSIQRLQPAEFLLRQSTGLLDVCRLQSLQKTSDPTVWRRLKSIHNAMGQKWKLTQVTPRPIDSSDSAIRSRWNEIRAKLIPLQQTFADVTPDAPRATPSPLIPQDRAILTSLPKIDGGISLWVINVRNVLIVCLMVTVPLGVWLVPGSPAGPPMLAEQGSFVGERAERAPS